MEEYTKKERIEDSTVHSHPFKAHYHGTETGDPGYLAVESGYIVPVGFATGFESILPTLAGASLQDQQHTGELTFIKDPPVGDYYMEATGEWRTTGTDGDNKIEMFEPHKAEILHHGSLTLTDDKKRALKVFRLESDGRVTQYIKSDIPMAPARTVPYVPPEPPGPGGSDSDSSKSSDSGSGSTSTSWPPYIGSDSSSTAPTKWATFVDHVYPELLYPGVSSNVQVKFRNDGDITWENPGFKLLPQAYDWGLFEVTLPGTTVKGVTREFNFTIHAPAAPGTYAFEWQMYGEGVLFGEKSPRVNILVQGTPPVPSVEPSSSSSSAPYNNAAFVNWFVLPEELETEQTSWITIKMRNLGTTTWLPGAYKLVPIGHDWGVFEVSVPTSTPPGAERAFEVEYYAPATPGIYDFQWQMAQYGVFGAPTPNEQITVVPRTGPPIIPPSSSSSGGDSGSEPPVPPSGVSSTNATFVRQHPVPSSLTAGSTTNVDVTFRNTGETAWGSSTHKMVTKTPDFNAFWGLSSVALTSMAPPGVERTFTVPLTAPSTTGNYPFRWQMYDGSTFFGEWTPPVNILVTPPSGSTSTS